LPHCDIVRDSVDLPRQQGHSNTLVIQARVTVRTVIELLAVVSQHRHHSIVGEEGQ
jgi:hypothetical protein